MKTAIQRIAQVSLLGPLLYFIPILIVTLGVSLKIFPWPFLLAWIYLPTFQACLLLAIFILVASYGESYLKSSYNFLLAIILFTLYMVLVPIELGDPWKTHLANFPPKLLWGSSILAHLLYKLVYDAGLEIDDVAPIIGFFSALCFFRLFDEANICRTRNEKAFSRIFYLCTTAHLLYCRGYIEITYPSVPCAILAILFLLRFLQKFQIRDYGFALFFISLASLIHGQNIGLLPAFPLLAIAFCLRQKEKLNFIYFSTVLIPAITIGIAILLLRFCFHYFIVPGDIYGGQSNVPFVPARMFFSLIHPSFVANLAYLACPAVLTIIFLYGELSSTKRLLADPFLAISALFSLAYFCFIYIWRFDLGYPRDIHLMVSPSFPIVMLSLLALLKIRRIHAWVAYLWLGFAMLLCWICISSLTVQGRQSGRNYLSERSSTQYFSKNLTIRALAPERSSTFFRVVER